MFIYWILFSYLCFGIWISSCYSFNSQITVKTFENDTVILPCHVDTLGVNITVRWRHDNKLIADSGNKLLVTNENVKLWGNMSLEIRNINQNDAGEYVCQAKREAPWGDVTQVHVIEVMYPPSVHSVPEAGELEVNLDDEAEMACVAKGFPHPTIIWRMNDVPMKLLDERSKLKFKADNRSLSGKYTCVADNGVGEPATASIDFKIRYKPEIEVKKSWIHASPGMRTQLDCIVSSYPDAQVEWYFDGEIIDYSPLIFKYTSGQINSLFIRRIKPNDYGTYICKATNIVGSNEANIELSGIANAAVFKESYKIQTNAFNFIWEVDSYSPIIEYQFWFRKYSPTERGRDWHKLFIPSGSDAIGPLHAKSFNLTGLNPATYYEALVLSRNRYGWSKPSKILRFATEGALPYKEHYKVELSYEETPPVVMINGPTQQLIVNPQSQVNSSSRIGFSTFNFILIVAILLKSFEHI